MTRNSSNTEAESNDQQLGRKVAVEYRCEDLTRISGLQIYAPGTEYTTSFNNEVDVPPQFGWGP